MVMLSDPAAIKALYREPGHGLPPGRNIFLEPILGSRSLLLLEGADHLAHRKLMLPAFHGERMRGFEPMVATIADADVDSWPLGEEFALHPHMQAITLEVILRIVFGVSDGPRLDRLRGLLRNLLSETGSNAIQLRALLMRRFGRSANVWGRFEERLGEVDELLFAEIAEHREKRRPRGPRRHPLGADPGPLRGRRRPQRPGPARPADDAAARRPRDDGDGAGLDLRPAAPPRAGDVAPARNARGRRRGLPAGGDHRVAATASGRPGRRPQTDQRPRHRRPRAAGRDRRDAGDLARPHPRAGLLRARSPSAPSASSRTGPTPTRGSPSAVRSGAASAAPSPSSRCGS